jgi:hypothetical protein
MLVASLLRYSQRTSAKGDNFLSVEGSFSGLSSHQSSFGEYFNWHHDSEADTIWLYSFQLPAGLTCRLGSWHVDHWMACNYRQDFFIVHSNFIFWRRMSYSIFFSIRSADPLVHVSSTHACGWPKEQGGNEYSTYCASSMCDRIHRMTLACMRRQEPYCLLAKNIGIARLWWCEQQSQHAIFEFKERLFYWHL